MNDESMKKGDGAMNAVPRPALMVAIVIGTLFMVEVGIMSFIHEFAETAHGLMDALILTAVLLPMLYFLIYRPFSKSVNDLRALSGTLERRVRERTMELEFSEALHRAVITSSADAIIRINVDGAILSANPAAHYMFGYGKTELENKHISLLLPDGYEKVLVEGFAASLDGWDGHSAASAAEAVAVTKSGKRLTVECTSSECLVNSEISFVIDMRDVSERRKAEKELVSIMEAQPDILYVINPKGALIKWNSALQELCGLTRDQMMGRPAAAFVCEEDRQVVFDGIKEVFEKGSASIEARFIRHDGALVPHLCNGAVWRDPDGEPLGFIGVGKDISGLKKVEEALRESEGRYRQLSDLSFEGISISVKGKIVDANTALAQMAGCTLDEIIGRSVFDLTTPESHAVIMEHINKGIESPPYEVTGIRKDGSLFRAEVKGHNILYHGQMARGTAIRDISERVKAEQALRESEGRYRQLSEASFEGVTITVDGKIVDCNTSFARKFGYAREEIIGKTPLDLVPPESYAIVADHIGRGSEERYEAVGLKKDGTLFPVEIRGRGTLYHGQKARVTSIRDISDRVQAEQAIRESEERLRATFDNATSGMAFVNPDGKFARVNAALCRMYGYGEKELIGISFQDITHPDDLHIGEAFLRKVARGGTAKLEVEKRFIRKDGGIVWCSVVASLIKDEHGKLLHLFAHVIDITARKEAEKNVRAAELRYRTFFKQSPFGVVINDVDTALPLEFNDLACQQLGYTREEFARLRVQDYEAKETPEETAMHIAKILQEGEDTFETKHRAKGGGIRDVLISIKLITLDGKPMLFCIFQDITERKAAEDELRRSEENLRKAQEIAHVGNWEWDMVSNSLRWSDEIYRIFGRTPGEFGVTYDAFLSYVHPDDRAYVQQEVNDAIAKRSRYDIDHRIITPDGGERIVHEAAEVSYDGAGRAVSMVGTVQDITERKRMEAVLLESEMRWHYALEGAGDGLWDWDMVTNKIYFSPRWKSLAGFKEDEFENNYEAWESHLHPEDKPKVLSTLRSYIDGKVSEYQVEFRMLCKDGSWKWIMARGSIISRDPGGKPLRMIGMHTDISFRKTAEDNLRASEQRFRAVAQSAFDAIISINSAGRIIHWNKGAEMMFGFAESEALGKPVEVIIPRRYDEAHRRGFARAAGGGSFRLVGKTTMLEGLRKDGAEFPLELSLAAWEEGGKTYFTGIIRDITERKAAEDRLKAAKEALSKAQELAHLGSWELDIQTGKVTWSDESYRIFGLEPGKVELTHEVFMGLVHPEDRKAVQENLHKVFSGRLLSLEDEARIIRPDGQERILFTNLEVVTGEDGKPAKLIGANLDITERKAAEEKLKVAKEAAEEATKLKDKFVSLVSHDLKTPLSSMIGFLHLVRDDYAEPLNEGAKLILDKAAESGQSMVRLIDDLLTISRFKTGQLKLNRQFFDADYLGVMMAGNYAHLARQKGIEIESTIPANSRVYGDKTLLTEAVQNLVTNAIKFCKSGDRISISLAEENASTICVRDTGPGIQPNLLADLFKFEKKTSTPGTAGETGTGFGLPLVKNIMELHGGELGVISEPGKGCLFSLALPYVRPRILLVDDDQHARLLQTLQLREMKADIIEAENGQDALHKMAGVRPDLIITDIQMPVMDGLELLKRIKGAPETKDIPVIVMSGEFGMEIRDSIFKFGGDDFVTKKTDKADFFPRVRRFIG